MDVVQKIKQIFRVWKPEVLLPPPVLQYDDEWSGQRNFNMILMRRITVQGFICTDHMADEGEASKKELADLAVSGKIVFSEDIREGLENYVSTVRLLMTGGNHGKLMLKL